MIVPPSVRPAYHDCVVSQASQTSILNPEIVTTFLFTVYQLFLIAAMSFIVQYANLYNIILFQTFFLQNLYFPSLIWFNFSTYISEKKYFHMQFTKKLSLRKKKQSTYLSM